MKIKAHLRTWQVGISFSIKYNGVSSLLLLNCYILLLDGHPQRVNTPAHAGPPTMPMASNTRLEKDLCWNHPSCPHPTPTLPKQPNRSRDWSETTLFFVISSVISSCLTHPFKKCPSMSYVVIKFLHMLILTTFQEKWKKKVVFGLFVF